MLRALPSHSSRFYHPHSIGWAAQISKFLIHISARPAEQSSTQPVPRSSPVELNCVLTDIKPL
jgi:hypothetical protein